MKYDFDTIIPRRGTNSYKWDTPEEENVLPMWVAAWLAPTMGLRGVWLAMCIELCFRGVIFLARLWGSNWIYKLRINR